MKWRRGVVRGAEVNENEKRVKFEGATVRTRGEFDEKRGKRTRWKRKD